jgi:TetR/AcrR family transcriptional repressor of nem operon
MKKGEVTRRHIVAQAAGLLNTRGYRSTPVSEIMRVTGLRKGGIYRHFKSRTTLTLEAFEYAVTRMRDRFLRAAEGQVTATDTLLAFLRVFREASHDEAFHGGCPIMNLAVESDDADPTLRNAARRAMTQLVGAFEQVIARGMRQHEFPKGDALSRARVLVATLEGGLLLGNLYKDRAPIEAVLEFLETYVRNGLR